MVSVSLGLRYMLLSALGFALMAVCVKLSFAEGIPLLEIVAARALVSIFLSYLDVKRKRISIWGENRPLLFARGLVGALSLICVYYAVITMPLAEATVIQYLHPAFAALLAFLFLGEHLKKATFVSILLSFAGILLVSRPVFLFGLSDATLPTLSVIMAVLGAFGSAIAYVLVRRLSQTEDSSVIIFYFPLVALPIAVLGLGDQFVMPSGIGWLYLLLVGIFTQVGQIGLTKAMQTETAARATAFSYTQVVFSALLGWWVFAEEPALNVYVGAALIILGAYINTFKK
jgi:drug/metabolite transporter (DMT)-like permease